MAVLSLHGGLMLEIFWTRAAKLQISQEYFVANIAAVLVYCHQTNEVLHNSSLLSSRTDKSIWFSYPYTSHTLSISSHRMYLPTENIRGISHHLAPPSSHNSLSYSHNLFTVSSSSVLGSLFVHSSSVAHLQLGLLRGSTSRCTTGWSSPAIYWNTNTLSL